MGSVDEETQKKLDIIMNRSTFYQNAKLEKQSFEFDNFGEVTNEGESLTTEQLHQVLLFLVDYRYINKEFSLNDANKGAGFANQIEEDAGKKLITYERAFKSIPTDGELPDEFFINACQIGRYIIANKSQKWIDIDPNDTDIKHLRILFNRISKFLQEKAIPTQLRVKGTGLTGTDFKNYTDVKEEPYIVDLATNSWALDIGLKDGDKVNIHQVKDLKGAGDSHFSELGIFSPRSDNYFYRIQEHDDDEFIF